MRVRMQVFIHGIRILTLVDPLEQNGTLVAEYEVAHANRFAQKLGYLRSGRTVEVLAGGRKGFIESAPNSQRITIRLAENR